MQNSPRSETVLVTGGCGYIGSHVVRQLSEQGYQVVVIDNLSTGFRSSLIHNETLITADLCQLQDFKYVFNKYNFSAVLHFAASIVVPDSVADPLSYYRNNVTGLTNLLHCAVEFNVKRVIFSSTAAVYGECGVEPLKETDATIPTSPYGWSKLFCEQILKDTAYAHGLKYMAFRYFNVAGADLKGRMGQRFPNATHLIKVASEVVVGKRDRLKIFGTDFPTADGTGVRDYIHVEDLASAHVEALHALENGQESDTLNCGYGRGYSVREVVATFDKILGHKLPTELCPRRPGDPAHLIANTQRIKQKLPQWQPQHNNLEVIIESALKWEQK